MLCFEIPWFYWVVKMVWLAKFLHYRGEIDIASRESFIIRKWKNWDSISLDGSFLGLNFQVIFENFLLEYTVSKRLVKVVKNYDALLCRSTKPISWSLRYIMPLFIWYPRKSSIFSGEKKKCAYDQKFTSFLYRYQ